jgi:hypothetical protein
MPEDLLCGGRLARKDDIGAGYISQSPIRLIKTHRLRWGGVCCLRLVVCRSIARDICGVLKVRIVLGRW